MDKRLADYLALLGADPAALDGWTIRAAQRDGEPVGFTISNGPEVHILPLVEGKSLSRRNIIEFIEPILDQFGYVTTRVPIAETEHRLRTALGFVSSWSDDTYSYWCMTRLRYARTQQGEPLCQSSS